MASLMSDKKRAENLKTAEAALKKARDYTKTTFTRWKPDWEQASRFYRDALKSYKLTGLEDQILAVSRESAVAHDEIGQYHQSATDLEAAANIAARDGTTLTNKPLAFDLYNEAAVNFRKNNSFDKAALMLVKAAEAIEAVDVDKGLTALSDGCSIFEDEQRGPFHDSTFKKAIAFAIKHQRYEAAIGLLERQNIIYRTLMSTFETDLYKNYLAVLVLLLTDGQVDAAIDKFKEYENNEKFLPSEQGDAASAIIEAYEDGDSDKLGEALKKNAIKYLQTPIAVLCKKLKMDGTKKPHKKKTKNLSDLTDDKEEDDFT